MVFKFSQTYIQKISEILRVPNIWDQCCHLAAETGSWYPLIGIIFDAIAAQIYDFV